MSLEDRAQEHEQMLWEQRNVDRKRLPDPAAPGDADYGPAECECGADMPAVRRAYRFRKCTGCAEAAERALRR